MDRLTSTFKLGCIFVMVWRVVIATHELPLIAMLSGRQTALDFVEIVYDGVLGSFVDAYEDSCMLVLMEDGVLRSKAPTTWRENHKIEKLI